MNFEKSIKLKSSLICSDCSKEELDRDLRDAQKAETNEGAKTTKLRTRLARWSRNVPILQPAKSSSSDVRFDVCLQEEDDFSTTTSGLKYYYSVHLVVSLQSHSCKQIIRNLILEIGEKPCIKLRLPAKMAGRRNIRRRINRPSKMRFLRFRLY